MRKFIITSPAYPGPAVLIYDGNGILVAMDMTEAKMSAAMTRSFKNKIPELFKDLETVLAGSQATVVEADFEVSFEMMWTKYNRKINKARCMLLWAKMEKSMQVKAYFGMEAYEKFLKKEHWRPKADPETYLRNRYWENEYR